MKEVKTKSVVPIYGMAAVWLAYCMLFPLYKLWHLGVLLVVSVGVYTLLSIIFPGKIEYVQEPEKPVTTGRPEIDAMLREGARAVAEMTTLRDAIKNDSVKRKTDEIIKITDQIFKDLLEDPADYKQVKHFADFYLPTTIKLLQTYDRMGSIGDVGENVTGTVQRIEAILDTTLEGYKKQLDGLFANQALDIETDITVLKSLMKKEGLTDKDF